MFGLDLRGSLNRLIEALPPKLGARFRFRLNDRRDFFPFGMPMNGQTARLEMTRQLLFRCGVEQIVETGTYRGTTTEWFAQFGLPMITVEINPLDHEFARLRLARWPNVQLRSGNSVEALSSLLSSLDTSRRTMFYLDAHWENYLPLADEIALIAEHFPASVVLVDDFQVPGDAGYTFDDYGPGKALTQEYLNRCSWTGVQVFYPSTPAAQETGFKRGCVVLTADRLMAAQLDALPLLRRSNS